jgi:hypothetical protein
MLWRRAVGEASDSQIDEGGDRRWHDGTRHHPRTKDRRRNDQPASGPEITLICSVGAGRWTARIRWTHKCVRPPQHAACRREEHFAPAD